MKRDGGPCVAVDPAEVATRARRLPAEPGVYRWIGPDREVLYVGKAQRLCDRVASYVDGDGGRKTDMVARAVDVDVFVTATNKEAILLENTLIKRHRPPYNVLLADDKTYPFIGLTKERFPRIVKTRGAAKGLDTFGPFPNEGAVNDLVRTMREGFGIRDCKTMLPQGCIKYELKLCLGPCFKPVADEYDANVDAVRRLLKGDPSQAVARMEAKMHEAAAKEQYEVAAMWRDRVARVRAILEKQYVFSTTRTDRDVVALAEAGPLAVACIVHERDGKVIGKEVHRLVGHLGHPGEDLARVVVDHYALIRPPPEVVVTHEVPDKAEIESVLSERRGAKVRLHVPQRGALVKLVETAQRNAKVGARELLVRRGQRADDDGLDALAQHLRLDGPPARIECVDISHLGGREVVASLVVLENGTPNPRLYRHYRIKDQKNDDFAAMHEVVTRRFTRLLREGTGLPDLFIVDGGAGQVSAAKEALDVLTVDVPLIGLAKRLEEVHRPGSRFPVRIPRDDPALHVLQRARDEAHRFAVRYGRRLRTKRVDHSPLDDVPGVGPVLKARVLKTFGGLEGVQKAGVDELAAVKGVGPALARAIRAAVGTR